MNFKKYTSIENSYREMFIQKVRESLEYQNCPDMLFSVSEKVDGCNTSVITDGNGIMTGKRTSALGPDEKFYGFQDFADTNLKDKTIGIYNYLKFQDPTITGIQTFGEFFGGGYKGYKSTESRIQKGIDYTPNHEFYAFDILVSYENGEMKYMDVDVCNALFKNFDFFYNEELFRGTLDECLAYNPVFISTIGKRLGYPEIEGNFAEGVVIKPVTPLYLANGDRIIIKNKNPKFEEFEKKGNKEPVVYSDNCTKCMSEVVSYCTEARMGNVISHIGEIELPKQMGLLIKEYLLDVIEEFAKDHPEYNTLSTNEQKAVNKVINKSVADIAKRKF